MLSSIGFGFFGSIWVDIGFVGIAILVGGWALYHGVKRHGSYIPASFYVAGLVALLVAHFDDFTRMPTKAEHVHGPLTTILSVVGGLCFVMFHLMNMRMQHRLLHLEGTCSCGAGEPKRTHSVNG